jgi:phage-related minor tail protein
MERLRFLQVAITEAQTAEAFERIAKAAFPQVAIEQYQDQLAQLQFTYNAVSTNAEAAFDPERTALEAERLAKIAISNRELAEIKAGIAAREKLTEDERKRAMDSVLQQHAKYLRQLEREAQFKQLVLTSERATAFIQQSQVRVRDIEREIEALQTRNRMQAEGFAPEFIEAEIAKLDIRRRMNELTKQLNTSLQTQIRLRDDLQKRLEAAAGPEKEELQRQLDAANAQIVQLRKQLEGVPAAGQAEAAAVDAFAREQTAPGVRIKSFIGEAERSLKDYEGMAIRVSQSVGDAVGNSLANGITGLIEGTTTAKEIFANFLKDVGQILLKEGTKMIATYVAIGIAKMFAGFFSNAGNASKPALPGSMGQATKTGLNTGAGNISDMFRGLAANGAYFDNGIAAFANGGMFTNSVVSSPTLFQFADGGVTRTGLMGEAGPEAIMPLERGTDGKLGVKAKLSEAMTRYRRPPGTDAAPEPGSGDSGSGGGGAAVAAPIDVRYTVERINSVDYVTADQFQRGMAQAAQQGATQGERRALTTLRQNTSQRKRIGI